MNGHGSSYSAFLQRGMLLREQGRYKEAAEALGLAIEADPERAWAYFHLACCYNDWTGHNRQALHAIDHAIHLDPTNATMHGTKGWILICQGKFHGALKVADEATSLDPTNIAALNALTNAHTKLGNWKEAEQGARRILEIYSHDNAALNLLAQALRLQGRHRESREIVDGILAALPNDAFAHTNAGYGALQAGDHLRANEHFLQALRLEPHSDFARRGLLQSLRARVWVFRHAFRWQAFIREPADWRRGLGFIAVVVTLAVGLVVLGSISPGALAAVVMLVIFYCYLCFFSYLFGDIFLLFDPMGRHALTDQDKWRTRFVCFFLGVILYGFIDAKFWGGVAFLVGSLLIFGFSIHYPRLRDHWQRWRGRNRE